MATGIDGFEVAGIRNEVHVELFSSSRGVDARSADVILHVACAEHAAGIHVFEAGDDLMRGLAGDVGHHVQAAAMAHGHDGIDATQIARGNRGWNRAAG